MTRPPVDQALWQPWIDHVCAAVGVDPAQVDTATLHRLSGEVATVYARPMAPVSIFLLGLATGAGMDADAAQDALIGAARSAGETASSDQA